MQKPNAKDLNEAKTIKKIARILFKRGIADAKAKHHMTKMRQARKRAFDDNDDSDHHHGKEYAAMKRHIRATSRFKKIANGIHPFKTAVSEAFSLRSKGTAIASILAKRHDGLANKYAYSDGNKLGRHERAAKRYKRIATGKKPFSEEEEIVEKETVIENENEVEINHTADIVNHMYDGNLDALKTSFEAGMADKVAEVLADTRLEIAASMFQPKAE